MAAQLRVRVWRARYPVSVTRDPACVRVRTLCVFAECVLGRRACACVLCCVVCAGVDRCFVGLCQCLLTVASSASILAPAHVVCLCFVSGARGGPSALCVKPLLLLHDCIFREHQQTVGRHAPSLLCCCASSARATPAEDCMQHNAARASAVDAVRVIREPFMPVPHFVVSTEQRLPLHSRGIRYSQCVNLRPWVRGSRPGQTCMQW